MEYYRVLQHSKELLTFFQISFIGRQQHGTKFSKSFKGHFLLHFLCDSCIESISGKSTKKKNVDRYFFGFQATKFLC